MSSVEWETAWAAPFTRYLEYVDDISNLVEVTRHGMGRVRMMPELLAMLDMGKEIDEGRQMQRKETQRLADLAAFEEQRGYPLLFAHSAVSLWGSLEVLVHDLAVAWLSSHQTALAQPPLSTLKLPVSTIQTVQGDELMVHIVSEALRNLKSDLKRGVGQFESLLEAVGLGGGVDQKVREGVFYLQQYRHLLVHRGGVADKQFTENCSALGFSVGDKVVVTQALYWELWVASQSYALTLRNRCRVADGFPIQEVATTFGSFVEAARAKPQPQPA